MSGSDSDSRPKRPSNDAASDDPWAKWRKPDAPAAEAEPKKAFQRDATVNRKNGQKRNRSRLLRCDLSAPKRRLK